MKILSWGIGWVVITCGWSYAGWTVFHALRNTHQNELIIAATVVLFVVQIIRETATCFERATAT